MPKTLRLLVVDDDPIDRMLVRDAFEEARLANPIIEASSGPEAMTILREQARPDEPFVVLLDIRMPGQTGLEFLETLRADVELGETIVYMLTTSDSPADVRAAYSREVSGYIVKSRAGVQFSELIEVFSPFWRLVELP